MRSVVLGGAGFIGSHLVDRLLARGDEVVVVDNLLTGRRDNAERHRANPRYTFVEHDICRPIPVGGRADVVFNLASPASPIDYAKLPLETLEVGSSGTRNALDLARAAGATLLHRAALAGGCGRTPRRSRCRAPTRASARGTRARRAARAGAAADRRRARRP